MEDHDKIIQYLYGDKTYKRNLLIVTCLIWGFLDIFSLSLGLLEIKPVVQERDLNNEIIYTGPLKYHHCLNNSQLKENVSILYETANSLVIHFQIYCDKYMVSLIGAANFLGVMIGSLISPFVIDHYGRRYPIIIAIGAYTVFLFLSTFSSSIHMMLCFIFCCGFCNLISHISVYILVVEVVSKEKRASYTSIIFNSFALFGIIFSCEFNFIQSWKIIFYITSGFVLGLFCLTWMYVKESPRFYLLKNDRKYNEKIINCVFTYEKEGEGASIIQDEAIRKFKKEEGKDSDLTETLLDSVNSDQSEVGKAYVARLNNVIAEDKTDASYFPKENLRKLFSPNVRNIFLTMCFMWFCIGGCYYGVLIMLKDTSGNVYYNYTMMYIVEIVSNVVAAHMMETEGLGRKKSMTILYLIGIFVIIGNVLYYYFFLNIMVGLLISFRFITAVLFAINYVYSTEYYSTDIRATGFALNAVCGRFAAIITPFLVEILEHNFFFYSLGVFSICLFLTFVLIETHGRELKQFTV